MVKSLFLLQASTLIFVTRYDYINSFILDYIAYSIHVSEVGGFYWYIIALQVEAMEWQLH